MTEKELEGKPNGLRRLYIDKESLIASDLLQTNITDINGFVVYTSTRTSERSKEVTLLDPSSTQLIKTNHYFGPRSTELNYCSPSSIFTSTSMSGKFGSRDMKFNGPNGTKLEWRYSDHRPGEPQLITLIEKGRGIEIAKLVRSGTIELLGNVAKAGELMFSLNATDVIDEALVVATSLVMIRKEMDRNKTTKQGSAGTGLGGGLFLGA